MDSNTGSTNLSLSSDDDDGDWVNVNGRQRLKKMKIPSSSTTRRKEVPTSMSSKAGQKSPHPSFVTSASTGGKGQDKGRNVPSSPPSKALPRSGRNVPYSTPSKALPRSGRNVPSSPPSKALPRSGRNVPSSPPSKALKSDTLGKKSSIAASSNKVQTSTKKSSSGDSVSKMSSSNHRISNNFPIKKRNKQDVVNEEEEDVVNEEEEEEEAAKAKRKRKHKYEKKKHNKQNKKIKNETSDSDSVSTGSNSNNETNDTAEQFVDVIVEGNELGDLEDEVTVNISEQHYILYNGGIRDVHFDANISTKEAQVIIDDMQRNIQSIDHRNSYVFVKQSNDTFTYGIVKSIYRDRDVTRVRIRIREDGGYKVFILNTDYIQRYIRRPYSTTKMRRLESMSQILTCLSQEEAAVAAGPNNGGAPFQFLPDNMHDTHKKGNKYQCTVIKEDGNACTSRKEYREDDQCFCRKHYRIYSLSKSGEATTCSDTDIYHCKKSTAREYYDKLINTNHKEHWSLVESRSDPLINKIVTSIKTMVAEKGYRFLSKSKNDNQFYVMPETLIDAKIIDAFLQLDASKRIPAELKFVDGSTIFPSVVCNYKDVDPNTSDAMGKHLLWLVKKSVISDLKIVGTYDPDITHRMNKRQPDGRYKTRWDKARITWDDGDREMEWVFKDYFVRQVLRKANAKPSSTCDLPTSVVHYQFEWNNRCYRMFLESCPGKFGAFYQFGLPCDGSNVLKIDPEKKTLEEIDPGSNYPTVSARGRMKFRVHRMVLFLWGGPNNSPWEMSNALEGDHKNSNIRDWCILNLQWLNQEQNTRKG